MTSKSFPLLTQIDEGVQLDTVDWNRNAFQTLLTSNLPSTTVFFYAIDVGLRRLESSFYETYWDATADALNDLSRFLFNPPNESNVDRSYLYEAKCQLLMYSAIAMIKMNTIRRRSIHDAKMSCATICSLLLQQDQSYETSNTSHEYAACMHSMRSRYLKRLFIIVQWLPTLSKVQMDDLQTNYERYITLVTDQLFPAVSLREKITSFIDHHLFQNQAGEDDPSSNEFVFIRRLPVFNEKIIHEHHDLMHIGLVNTLNQLNDNLSRKLICCIWTVCCMIEADRVSLGTLCSHLLRDHFSLTPVDFEDKPIRMESLNERDLIVFLLLCAQQNVHLHGADSTLHPYLLYSASHLCTQHQKNWWQTALDQTPWNDFVDHLATIRLDEDRLHQHPPKLILLNTARILFHQSLTLYEQNAKRAAASYEHYAQQYLQMARKDRHQQGLSDSLNKTQTQGSKQDKLFFFYAQKLLQSEKNLAESLLEQCEKLARQCEEIKRLPEPEPPRTSSPAKEQQVKTDIDISAVLSPEPVEQEEEKPPELDSTLFATPPANKSRDVDVQTLACSPSPPPMPMPSIEETVEPARSPLPPLVEMIFAHMDHVNQSINKFCASTDAIQQEINTIRDRLDKVNRTTNQMLYSNVRMMPSETISHSGAACPSHQI